MIAAQRHAITLSGVPNMLGRLAAVIVLAAAFAAATAAGALAQPATAEGARAVAAQFLADAPGDKKAALAKLRPTAADYRAVYREPLAGKLEEVQKTLWDSGQGLSGRPGQTELIVVFARTDDLIDGKPVLDEFPGGYKGITSQMVRGVPIVRFKMVEPGKTAGIAVDGLIHVNGRWVLIPRPWNTERGQ